jgi:predicted GNAT family acetyltransferase
MVTPDPPVVDNRFQSRFELQTHAGMAVLNYHRSGERLVLLHTEVPPAAREEGAGSRLVEAAFLEAREQGLRVSLVCPFARAWAAEHPEVAGLVEER